MIQLISKLPKGEVHGPQCPYPLEDVGIWTWIFRGAVIRNLFRRSDTISTR